MVDPQHIIAARDVVNNIYIDDRVKDYIVDIVWATREPASYNLKLEGLVRYGASPRHNLSRAGRACSCFPERTRLRHTAGHQEHWSRRFAPSHYR